MVSTNPVFAGGLWSVKKFQATVINDIWPEVIFFTLVGTSEYARTTINYPHVMLTTDSSGGCRVETDRHFPCYLESNAYRAWYGARFGYFIQNFHGV